MLGDVAPVSNRRSRLLAALPAVAFALTALFGLAFQLRLPHTLPTDADYQAAARVLEVERAPGDVVLLHPWWTERARLFVPPSIPVVGYLGDTGDDLVAHPRVWVLADERLPFVPDADFRRRFLPDRTPLAAPRQFGPLTLTPYRNGRARQVRFSAVDALAQAEVTVESSGVPAVPCPRSGDSFLCRSGRAEPAWHEVLYQPVRCLFVVPPGGPARITVRFPEVPAGTLFLEAGHHLGARLEARPLQRAARALRSDRGPAPPHPRRARGLRLRRRPDSDRGAGDADRPGRRSARAGGVHPASLPGRAAVSRAPARTDRRIALALGLVTFAVLWATEKPVGFVRDESVYFAAAEQFARWWAAALPPARRWR